MTCYEEIKEHSGKFFTGLEVKAVTKAANINLN